MPVLLPEHKVRAYFRHRRCRIQSTRMSSSIRRRPLWSEVDECEVRRYFRHRRRLIASTRMEDELNT